MNMHGAYTPASADALPWGLHARLFVWSNDSERLVDRSNEWNLADQVGAMEVIFSERATRGMSLLDMEERSGVSFNTAYQWRSGERCPELPNLVALAETLGFEVVMRSKLDPDIVYDAANLRRLMAALDCARKGMSITTKELRATSSVATNSYYSWLKHQRAPTLKRFAALAEALGFEMILRRQPMRHA